MNREEIKKRMDGVILGGITGSGKGFFSLLDWLYDNNYEIIRPESSKSKFMEEWERVGVTPSEVLDGVGIWRVVKKLVELIDKHKSDKEAQ